VHPIVPLLFWSPVVAWLLWRSVFVHELPVPGLLGIALAGLLVWTLSEYALHASCSTFRHRPGRPVPGVHVPRRAPRRPRDKTRLVMPPRARSS